MTLTDRLTRSSATQPLGHFATRRGSVYVEYFILALLVALATIAFWQSPNGFQRARTSVENAYGSAVTRVLAP